MSCCFGFRMKDGLVVAVDGRESVAHNGKKYRVREDLKKYIIKDNKLIVTFGLSSITEVFREKLMNEVKTIDEAFDIIVDESIIKRCKSVGYEGLLTGVFKFDLEQNRIIETCHNGTEKEIIESDIPDIFNFGFNQAEIHEVLKQEIRKSNDVFEILKNVFDRINSVSVGGHWTISCLR